MNILITSAGRRVSLVRAFQKELKLLKPESKVFTADHIERLSSACQVSDGAFKLPLVKDVNYIEKLLELCKNENVVLIVPTIDTELLILAKHHKTFFKQGITPLVPHIDFVNQCRDKRLIHQFFEAHKIPVAKEYSKFNYQLPLFIKPINGSRSVDTFVITKHLELNEYHFRNDDLMFLEYLDHDFYDEYTCDLYYDRNHLLKCVVPRKRIEVREGEVNKGITDKNILVSLIRTYLNEIPGAVGCLTAQFFKHKENNTIYGIEINARFGGGFPLTYLAGANYPKWLIKEYMFNQTIEFFNDWEDRLLMLRYDNEILVHDYYE